MVTVLAQFAPAILIVSGLLAIAWLSENIAERMGKVGEVYAILIKIFAALGFFIGILAVVTGVVVWVTPTTAFPPGQAPSWVGDFILIALLLVIGIANVMNPWTVVPWAALLGLVGGLAAAGVAVFIMVALGVSLTSYWLVIAIIFIVVGGIIFFLFKWIEELLEFIAKVLTFPLISVPLGFIAIGYAIIILLA
ncbi:MAG: hypothetical protein KAI34_04670 [Candidatus Lokiarchaeota archaeon]|nr:hypothetical protein [Candidatus Lokiarchaeota archaeon]